MASKVVLDKEEINRFTTELLAYHQTMLTAIQDLHDKVYGKNNTGAYYMGSDGLLSSDFFRMDQTSENLKMLLELVDTNVLPLLYQTLGESNECARLLVEVMSGVDS